MRERISRAVMIDRAQRCGYLWGRSLRTGPGTHHDHWRAFCTAHGIAFISLSLGRHRAAVEFDLGTIRPDLAFWDAVPLYRELLHAIDRVRESCDDPERITLRDGVRSLEVRGVTTDEGAWLARRFVDVAGRYHRELAELPENVVNLQEYRRQRARRGIA